MVRYLHFRILKSPLIMLSSLSSYRGFCSSDSRIQHSSACRYYSPFSQKTNATTIHQCQQKCVPTLSLFDGMAWLDCSVEGCHRQNDPVLQLQNWINILDSWALEWNKRPMVFSDFLGKKCTQVLPGLPLAAFQGCKHRDQVLLFQLFPFYRRLPSGTSWRSFCLRGEFWNSRRQKAAKSLAKTHLFAVISIVI